MIVVPKADFNPLIAQNWNEESFGQFLKGLVQKHMLFKEDVPCCLPETLMAQKRRLEQLEGNQEEAIQELRKTLDANENSELNQLEKNFSQAHGQYQQAAEKQQKMRSELKDHTETLNQLLANAFLFNELFVAIAYDHCINSHSSAILENFKSFTKALEAAEGQKSWVQIGGSLKDMGRAFQNNGPLPLRSSMVPMLSTKRPLKQK